MDDILIAALAHQQLLLTTQLSLMKKRRTRRQKRDKAREYWVHPINQSRDTLGVHHQMIQQLRLFPQKHHEYLRMSSASFDHILVCIKEEITKQDTTMRKAIAPDLKLALALHKLASNCDYGTIHKHFRVGKSTAARIVVEVCEAIWERMSPTYLRQPKTVEDWEEVAKGFAENWNFPTCLGAIDGKHITIQKPRSAGSQDFNYKRIHSINLMAIADSCYRFLVIDVGQYGSESDGGVWESSGFNKLLTQGNIRLPISHVIPETGRELNYVFVADEAFPLKDHIMRPFPGRDLNSDLKKIYNYRLSRARRVIENAFGILTQRWKVVQGPTIGKPDNIEKMVAATAVLHNYLCINNDRTYLPSGSTDAIYGAGEGTRGYWCGSELNGLQQAPGTNARNYTVTAANARTAFSEYFMNEGAVEWQLAHINRRAN